MMLQSARWVLRRLAAVAAVLAIAATLTVAAGAPAQAVPPGGCSLAAGYSIDGNQNIHAHRLWACTERENILLPVSIQRFVSPGVWMTVASGTGFVTYFCNGHALNIYRTTGTPQFFNTCG